MTITCIYGRGGSSIYVSYHYFTPRQSTIQKMVEKNQQKNCYNLCCEIKDTKSVGSTRADSVQIGHALLTTHSVSH